MLWLLMSHGAQQRHLRNNPTLACSDGISYQIPYNLAANPGLWEYPSCTRPGFLRFARTHLLILRVPEMMRH